MTPRDHFVAYRESVDGKRIEAKAGDSIKLDEDAAHPVVITFVAVNGNGLATENENDLSLVTVIEHAGFRAEIGGDLSGEDTPGSASSTRYRDIETSVADLVGEIDLYKVHHHCSAYSTNETWLDKTKPTIAIMSVGNGDRYGHPAEDCVNRLHGGGVKRIYWTENGKGVDPEPTIYVVSGTVVVEVEASQPHFAVLYQSGRQRESFRIKSVASQSTTEGDGESAADMSPKLVSEPPIKQRSLTDTGFERRSELNKRQYPAGQFEQQHRVSSIQGANLELPLVHGAVGRSPTLRAARHVSTSSTASARSTISYKNIKRADQLATASSYVPSRAVRSIPRSDGSLFT